jgi:hypothetical protein
MMQRLRYVRHASGTIERISSHPIISVDGTNTLGPTLLLFRSITNYYTRPLLRTSVTGSQNDIALRGTLWMEVRQPVVILSACLHC